MKIAVILLFATFVWSNPTNPIKGQVDDQEWEEIKEILKEYDVGVETVGQKMTTYWADKKHADKIQEMVMSHLPPDANVEEALTKYDEVQAEEDEVERFYKLMAMLKEVGIDQKAVFTELVTYSNDLVHMEKFMSIILQLLPPDVDALQVKEKLKSVLNIQ